MKRVKSLYLMNKLWPLSWRWRDATWKMQKRNWMEWTVFVVIHCYSGFQNSAENQKSKTWLAGFANKDPASIPSAFVIIFTSGTFSSWSHHVVATSRGWQSTQRSRIWPPKGRQHQRLSPPSSRNCHFVWTTPTTLVSCRQYYSSMV